MRGEASAHARRECAEASASGYGQAHSVPMGRTATGVLYVLAMVAVVDSVDILFFRHHFSERLAVNIGIVLVFAAFYFRSCAVHSCWKRPLCRWARAAVEVAWGRGAVIRSHRALGEDVSLMPRINRRVRRTGQSTRSARETMIPSGPRTEAMRQMCSYSPMPPTRP
jgi:hypothetical protein